MKNNYFFTGFVLAAFLFLYCSQSPAQENNLNEQREDYFHQFTISTSSYFYFPEENVNIVIYPNGKSPDLNYDIKVYRINDPEQFISSQGNKDHFDMVGSDSSNLSGLCSEVYSASKKIRTKDIKDKKGNVTTTYLFDTTVFSTGRKGVYIIRITNAKKIAYTGFIVTTLGLIEQIANNSVLCYTTDKQTGEPIDSAQLSFYLNRVKVGAGITSGALYNKTFTDEQREYALQHSGSPPLIIAINGDDVTLSDPDTYFNFTKSSFKGYVYTNQPVYRPPSVVQFKGIIRENNSEGYFNYPNEDVLLVVNDSKGAEILKKTVKTNEFGSFNDSVEIEPGAPVGNYTITATIETAIRNKNKDANQDSLEENNKDFQSMPVSFSGSFSIEEYKKPEYKVEVKTDKDQYTNGNVSSIDVKADYYFGSPVQEADVTYKIFKKPLYRPWWYFSEYRWMYESYYQGDASKQQFYNASFIYEGNGKLDKEGKLKILYSINEKFKEKYISYYYSGDQKDQYYETDYTYIIQVNVKDKSRHNVAGVKTVNVTRAEFLISSRTDKYVYKPGEKIGVEVHAVDFSDKGIESNFNVSVIRYTYEGKYPKVKKVTSFVTSFSGRTVKSGEGTAFFESAAAGYYEIEVTSFDSKGKKITDKQGCFVASGDMGWWYHQPGTIEIIPDKESYSPGDTCHALIVTSDTNANVLITSKNNNILYYKIEKIEGSSGYVNIPINDNNAPNFNINALYLLNGRIFNAAKSVLVIPEKSFVQVGITSDKPIYKPKEEGEFIVSVKDKQNNPVTNAEVSIGIIDESIYAIKEENTPDIKNAFYSPSPVYDYTKYNDRQGFYYQNRIASRMQTLFDRFNYKSYKKEDLCKIRGRLIDLERNPISGMLILIDKQYYAGVTSSEGTYEFSIPEGAYTFSFLNYYNTVPGEFNIFPAKGKNVFLDIKGDYFGILSAYWNDDVGSYLNIIGGRGNEESYKKLWGTQIDTISIYEKRRTVGDETSGKIIGQEFIENTGIHGLDNIVAKQTGTVKDEKGNNLSFRGGRVGETNIIIDGVVTNTQEEEINYVEAETRTDFRDAVYWTSSVVTDGNGEAKIKMKFPDNLTTWRITARIITKDTKVGQSSYTVISRKDLIVRMEAPRFLQEKDEVVISTILHNYLNEEKQTKLTLKLDNLKLDPLVNPEQIIKLGKNEERRIDWKVKVTEPKGMAKLFASALTNEESDAVEVKVPLQPHGLQISNYKSFDISKVNGSHDESFELPEEADMRSSSLRIGISPSIASSVLGSLEALLGYPYGCMEQTMSRFIPTIIAANVLKETGLSETEFYAKQMPKMVKLSFAKVKSMQHNDGGWGWWSNGSSSPFMSAYVVYGLSLAENAGFKVDKDVYKKGITFLLNNIKINSINNTTRAYMIYALAETDSVKHNVIKSLLKDIEGAKLNDFDKGLLSLASGKIGEKEMQRQYNTELIRNVRNDENGAWWGGKSQKYSNWYDDNVQATSIVLKALLADAVTTSENKDVIEDAVKWLMSNKKGVYWCNTQQSAFAIYALTDYLKSTNELNPDYSLKIFVNNSLLAEKHITRADILSKEIAVYADGKTLKHGKNIIRIEKSGIGKSYITASEIYYTSEKKIKSREDGFDIERTYFTLEKFNDYKNNKIVYRKKVFDGEVKSGDVILVKVTVTPREKDNQYFMLEDPIPAGCEIVNDDWAYPIEKEEGFEGYDDDNWRWWYTNKEVRDNRVVFFATNMANAEYEFSYLLRAETPGIFNALPSHGSLMYYPDISGSSDEIRIMIGE